MSGTKFIIKWEVTWTPDGSEEELLRYTETVEHFDDEENIVTYEDFMDNYDELIGDDRFTPEMNVQEYIDSESGHVNIEYVAIYNEDMKLLWRENE